jgi:membrane peptidoglycan carboxypeptidase
MHISLVRRQRRRRNGAGRPPSGGSSVRRIALVIPLFLFAALLAVGALAFTTVVTGYSYYSTGLPDPKEVFANLTFDQETRVLDRAGKVQLATFAREKRDVVGFAELSPEVVDATTAVEDKTFWENAGFDPAGIISAGIDTLQGQGRGASTITQQLVRNRLLPAKYMDKNQTSTWERKIREIIQSVRLTEEFKGLDGKQQILTAYLNDNFYGNQSYGIAAAARGYWNITDLHKLSLSQAATLAAIPQSPTAYDLMRNAVEQDDPKHPGDAKYQQLVVPPDTDIYKRRNKVLSFMEEYATTPGITQLSRGKYTTADFEAAKKEDIVLTPPTTQKWLAPQFVLQVKHQLGGILCSPTAADSCDKVDTGGYTVITTLDWKMQRVAERWVQASARGPNSGNLAKYVAALKIPTRQWMRNMVANHVHNAALASVDYRTGQVYTYVGSAGFYLKGNKKFQPQFDVLEDGWRQPGSAFKPINYLIGIDDKTLTAASLFMDVATDFGGGYTPGNADPYEHGPVRMREAIQTSLNIPAVKAGIEIGNRRVWTRAKDFGIRWQTSAFAAGPSIAIGTVELHIIDLISAYGAIANGGVLMPRTTILEIRDSAGTVIWPAPDSKPQGKRVVSAASAYVMTNILASNTDPAQNFFWGRLAIYDGGKRRPATIKTGTNNDEKDLTAVGYVAAPKSTSAPALVTGTWMGNSDNSAPTGTVHALESAASLWSDYMSAITKGTPIADFKVPKGVVQKTIDAYSGMLPGSFKTKTIQEWFVAGTEPKQRDNTKVGIEVDSATGKLWQEGCEGPKVTKGFLDLSKVESKYPQWKKYNLNWIARAAKGAHVGGGVNGTVTEYFHGNGWYPFGRSWGAPVAPTETCPLYTPPPSAPPSGEPPVSPPPSVAP